MIRTAIRADTPGIRALMKSVPGFWSEDWRGDALERALDSARELAFVWEEDQKLIGFICAHDVGFRAYLSALLVEESTRGHGIGTKLLGHIESELKARGSAVLIADVWKEAKGFYQSHGWSPPDVILMRKRLIETNSQQVAQEGRGIKPPRPLA
jgi:predicted N-acetyltransferase YhbS